MWLCDLDELASSSSSSSDRDDLCDDLCETLPLLLDDFFDDLESSSPERWPVSYTHLTLPTICSV